MILSFAKVSGMESRGDHAEEFSGLLTVLPVLQVGVRAQLVVVLRCRAECHSPAVRGDGNAESPVGEVERALRPVLSVDLQRVGHQP